MDGDPTPGVVESVQALAKEFGDFAHDAEAAYHSLSSFGSDATALQWVGQTADAFKGQFGPLPGRLQKLYTSYSEASDALSAYAPLLQAAQTKADTALRQAQDAHADLQRATTNANTAATDLKTAQQNHATTPNPQAVTDAQTAHDTAQTNLTNAKAKMAALTKQANDAYNDRITAAKTCGTALHHAQSDGIHNKHWWEHVGAALSEWGGEIGKIAGEIAPVLDIIALATSWIPGVDVVTAALAEADNIVALAGTAMATIGDAMQGHWGDALLGAGMLALTFVGARAFGSEAEAVEGEAGGIEGEANALEGSESSLAGKGQEVDGTEESSIGGDPVDLVTGQMIDNVTDLDLPGVLPLILRRTYASGYRTGRLFGPGWSSTIDQRMSINEAGIHFAGDDAQTLHYPLPTTAEPVLPENGARWPLTWDRDTDEIRLTDPATGLTRHFAVVHFTGDLGQIRDLTAISDRNGNRVTVHRDEFGTPSEVEHSGGYRVRIGSVASAQGPRITELRLLDGGPGTNVMRYDYDERGRLTHIVDATDVPHVYDYDEQNRITAWTDRLGYRYEYHYDELGRVARSSGVDGVLAATFAYDRPNRTTTITNSLGHAAAYTYDEYGRVVQITNPLGATEAYEHDKYGRTLKRIDASGQVTQFERDARGNVLRVVEPDRSVTSTEYNALDQPVKIITAEGATWRYEYDDRGNMVAVVDPCGAQTRYAYGEHGQIHSATDALGRVTVIDTDAAGLPMTVTDPIGGRTALTRDGFGRVTAITDQLDRATRFGWTGRGDMAWRENPAGERRSWEYDHLGQAVTETDAAGGASRFEYGPFGKVVARTDPAGVRRTFGYDTELRLSQVSDPSGSTWRYTFDGAGNLLEESDFTGRTVHYRYDANRQLIERVTAAGDVARLTRDVMGRVVRRETPEGATVYEYSAGGRLAAVRAPRSTVTFTRDAAGRITAEDVDGRTTEFDFDLMGYRVARTTPSGATSQWGYDLAGRPMAFAAGDHRIDFDYDAAGRERVRTLGADTWITREFDDADRLARQSLWTRDQASAGASPTPDRLLADQGYAYDLIGSPATILDAVVGQRSLRADATGRITAVEAATWSESYAYDSSGNLSSATVGADQSRDTDGLREYAATTPRRAGRTHYEHDAAGRLVRTIRRTLSGGQRQTSYRWDSDDRLIEVTTPDGATWRYEYDALGRRSAKLRLGADGGVVERVGFTWDGTRLAEQESRGFDGRVDVLTWDYEPNTWRAAAQRRRSWAVDAPQSDVDEAFHAIVTDLVGTPTELVTPEGRIVWRTALSLFGEQIAVTAPDGDECPLRFPGQYHDAETGLHYNLHRYYDPATAGYLSPDPLGLGPAPNDRGYVPNPLVWIDPLGLYPQDKYPPTSPAFKGDPYHPDEVADRLRANQEWPGRVPEPSAPSGDPAMIGANGTQITSQTAWNEGPYRIDVENPDPGGRPGQMHFQDQTNKSAKYYWDHQNGGFQGMPNKLANKLSGNRGYQNGIKKGLNWLGESQ
uniref:DUF6531 domain-containing protein n=1 Tax=Catenulispora acidiphila TaxID=304895 RepID=UPI001CBBF03D|nr:DUF6531 domain-containing protein [Catenulispora acidiphila]